MTETPHAGGGGRGGGRDVAVQVHGATDTIIGSRVPNSRSRCRDEDCKGQMKEN